MNRENIKIVRDHIAALDAANFDMAHWHLQNGHCGTVACIGGWTEALLYKRGFRRGRDEVLVGKRLGLSAVQAERLFYPHGSARTDWSSITTAEAVRVLDHLLETGEVDWSIIDKGDQ